MYSVLNNHGKNWYGQGFALYLPHSQPKLHYWITYVHQGQCSISVRKLCIVQMVELFTFYSHLILVFIYPLFALHIKSSFLVMIINFCALFSIVIVDLSMVIVQNIIKLQLKSGGEPQVTQKRAHRQLVC